MSDVQMLLDSFIFHKKKKKKKTGCCRYLALCIYTIGVYSASCSVFQWAVLSPAGWERAGPEERPRCTAALLGEAALIPSLQLYNIMTIKVALITTRGSRI